MFSPPPKKPKAIRPQIHDLRPKNDWAKRHSAYQPNPDSLFKPLETPRPVKENPTSHIKGITRANNPLQDFQSFSSETTAARTPVFYPSSLSMPSRNNYSDNITSRDYRNGDEAVRSEITKRMAERLIASISTKAGNKLLLLPGSQSEGRGDFGEKVADFENTITKFDKKPVTSSINNSSRTYNAEATSRQNRELFDSSEDWTDMKKRIAAANKKLINLSIERKDLLRTLQEGALHSARSEANSPNQHTPLLFSSQSKVPPPIIYQSFDSRGAPQTKKSSLPERPEVLLATSADFGIRSEDLKIKTSILQGEMNNDMRPQSLESQQMSSRENPLLRSPTASLPRVLTVKSLPSQRSGLSDAFRMPTSSSPTTPLFNIYDSQISKTPLYKSLESHPFKEVKIPSPPSSISNNILVANRSGVENFSDTELSNLIEAYTKKDEQPLPQAQPSVKSLPLLIGDDLTKSQNSLPRVLKVESMPLARRADPLKSPSHTPQLTSSSQGEVLQQDPLEELYLSTVTVSGPPLVSYEELLLTSNNQVSPNPYPYQESTAENGSQRQNNQVKLSLEQRWVQPTEYESSVTAGNDPNQSSHEAKPKVFASQTYYDPSYVVNRRSEKQNPPTGLHDRTIMAAPIYVAPTPVPDMLTKNTYNALSNYQQISPRGKTESSVGNNIDVKTKPGQSIYKTYPPYEQKPLKIESRVTSTNFYQPTTSRSKTPAEVARGNKDLQTATALETELLSPMPLPNNSETQEVSTNGGQETRSSSQQNSESLQPSVESQQSHSLQASTDQSTKDLLANKEARMLEVIKQLKKHVSNYVNASRNQALLTRAENALAQLQRRKDGESSSQQTPESAPTTQLPTQVSLGNNSPRTASPLDRTDANSTAVAKSDEERVNSFQETKKSLREVLVEKKLDSDEETSNIVTTESKFTKAIMAGEKRIKQQKLAKLAEVNGNGVEPQGSEPHQHSRKESPPQVDFDAKSPVSPPQSLLDAVRASSSEAVQDHRQEVKSLEGGELFSQQNSNNEVKEVKFSLPDLTSITPEKADSLKPQDFETLIEHAENKIKELKATNPGEEELFKAQNRLQTLRKKAEETQESATTPQPLPQVIEKNTSPSASSSIGLEPSTQDESTQSTHALRATNIATTLPTTEALHQSALEITEERNSAPPMPGAGSEHQQITPTSEQNAPKSANDIKKQPFAVSNSVSHSPVLKPQQNLFAGTIISQEFTDSSTQGLQVPQLASDKVGGQEVPGPASSDVPEQPGEKNDPKSRIEVPSATPSQPQDPKNNSSCYTYLSSFYKNFVASLESFKEGLKTTFAFGKKTDETKDTNTPNSTMRARIWEALVGMIPNRFKPTSNAESSIEDPLLPKEKEGIGRS
jgi:hypothetical protein